MKFNEKNGGFAMRQWISKRQAAIGPNTMMALFANAKKYPDVINLSIGDPDIPTPQAILDAMYQDSCKGHTKYTPSKGDPELCLLYTSDAADE